MLCSLVALFAHAPHQKPIKTELALQGLDPVELVYHRSTFGKPSISSTYLGHEYRFDSQFDKNAFDRDPVRFAVRFGGSCATHGSLGRKGIQSIHSTFEGRNYVFCSYNCKSRFLSNSQAYIDEPPAPEHSSEKDINEARALYDRAKLSHGYLSGLNPPSVQWVYEGEQKLERYTFIDSDTFVYSWGTGDTPDFYALDPKAGPVESTSAGDRPMHPDEIRALKAVFFRHPSGILALGRQSVIGLIRDTNEKPCGFIQSTDGISTEVKLDLATYRIQKVKFRDRFNGPVSTVEREFNDEYAISGIWMPVSSRLRIDGGAWGQYKTASSLEVNCQIPDFLPSEVAKRAWE